MENFSDFRPVASPKTKYLINKMCISMSFFLKKLNTERLTAAYVAGIQREGGGGI